MSLSNSVKSRERRLTCLELYHSRISTLFLVKVTVGIYSKCWEEQTRNQKRACKITILLEKTENIEDAFWKWEGDIEHCWFRQRMFQTVILYSHKIIGLSSLDNPQVQHSPKAYTFTCHHSTISVKKRKGGGCNSSAFCLPRTRTNLWELGLSYFRQILLKTFCKNLWWKTMVISEQANPAAEIIE